MNGGAWADAVGYSKGTRAEAPTHPTPPGTMDDTLLQILSAYKAARDGTAENKWIKYFNNPLLETLLDQLEEALYEHEEEGGEI